MGIISVPVFPVGLTSGYSDRIDLADAVGRPGGVEAVFEFNGAFFNVRTWLDTFLITTIDGLADPDIRDSREVNPGRHGETYFNSYYGGRTIVLSGKMRAHTLGKLRNMQTGLKEIFGDISREYPLVIRTGDVTKDVMISCKKYQSIAMAEIQQDFTFRRDFQITLRASNPYFFSVIENINEANFAAGYIEEFNTPAFVKAVNVNESQADFAGWGDTSGAGTVVTVRNKVWQIRHDTTGIDSFHIASFKRNGQRFAVNPGNIFDISAIYRPIGITPIKVDLLVMVSGGEFNFPLPLEDGELATSGGFYRFDFLDNPPADTEIPLRASVRIPANARGIEFRIRTYLADRSLTEVNIEYSRISGVIRASSSYPDYFDGDDHMARWSGAYGRSSSEYLGTTGLEGRFSVPSALGGLGNFSVRNGVLIGNGSAFVPHMVYENLPEMTKFRAILKYTVGPDEPGTVSPQIVKQIDPFTWVSTYYNSNRPAARFTRATGAFYIQTPTGSGTIDIRANTTYWMRVEYADTRISIEHWLTDPRLGGSPTATASYTMSTDEQREYGGTILGTPGIRLLQNRYYTYDDFTIVPEVDSLLMRSENRGNTDSPTVFNLHGPISSLVNGDTALTLRRTDRSLDELVMIIRARAGSREAVPADHYLELDSERRTAKLFDADGVLVQSAYSQIDIDSDWIELSPGANHIEVIKSVTSEEPVIELRYRHTYL